MSFPIKTNVGSLSAQQTASATQRETQKIFAKLSSGSRVNSAQDDAAGLAIAVGLAAHVTSNQQAIRNGGDALNVSDTAEAALGQAGDILGQLRELAVASGSGGLNDNQRQYLQTQANALRSELDRIASATEYNGTALLNNSSNLGFQVGTDADPNNSQINISTADVTASALGVGNLDISTQNAAQGSVSGIDDALQMVSSARATLGAQVGRVNSAISNGMSRSIAMAAAHSRIADADMAEEASALSKNMILGKANVAVLAQANQNGKTALRLLGSR